MKLKMLSGKQVDDGPVRRLGSVGSKYEYSLFT